MSRAQIKNIIEAALMVSDRPLDIARLAALFEGALSPRPERDDIRSALFELQADYEGRGVELAEVASGFRFQARAEYGGWVQRLFEERPPRYSRALLETLAIIAYRQPVTRAEIEQIRGVSVSSAIVKALQERGWIKIVGQRDAPGKPALLATTRAFLDYFNLKRLSDLPALADIRDFDSINPDLFEALKDRAQKSADSDSGHDSDDSAEMPGRAAEARVEAGAETADPADTAPGDSETGPESAGAAPLTGRA